MKLQKMSCPNCNGMLNMDIDSKTTQIYCPYCGQKFAVDDGKQEFTINRNINKNININKTVTNVNRHIDDAEVIKATSAHKELKYTWIGLAGVFIMLIGLIAYSGWMAGAGEREAKKAQAEGLISAGSYSDYQGEKFDAVVNQLEALGFNTITTVDLDDSGLAFWSADEVESVSIGGNTSFEEDDYFDSDVTIVITYH